MCNRKLGRLAWITVLALLFTAIVPFQAGQPSAYADPVVTVVANPPVPAYVHPRILITPSELPALRTRLTDSAIGRRSMASIRAWIDYLLYDDPLDQNERLLPLYSALVQGDPAVLANFPTSYASYVPLVLNLEGFYALIQDDSAKAAEVAQALVTTVNILNDTIPTSTNLKGAFGSELFPLGYCYDFIYNYMTEAQRGTVRSYISSITTGKVLPVSTNPDPRLSRDNIAPVGTQWALLALAIEGETGYDPNVYSQAVKTMNAYFRYGLYDTGAPTEDMHYLNYGMSFGAQTLIAMDKRGDSLFNHPSFQNLVKWYVNSIEPYGYKFTTLGDTTNDLGGLLPNYVLLKWLHPDDPVIDFIWRNRVRDDYTGIKLRNDFLMAALYGLDWEGGEDTEATPVADQWGVDLSANPPIVTLAPYNPAALNLPKSFIDSNRGLYITRDKWATDAMTMHFETNTDQFGPTHTHSNVGDFTLTALGQKWAIDRGYQIFESQNHSIIQIDGKGQGFYGPYGKTDGLLDGGLATLFVGNAKNAYDYKYTFKGRRTNPENQGYTWEFEPRSLWSESSVNSTWRASYNPVQKAFRTAALIRGTQPYVMIFDDIRKDNSSHEYEWVMQVPNELEAKSASGSDLILGRVSETSGTPRMLVRSLASGTPALQTFEVVNSPETGSYQGSKGTGKKVVIGKEAVEPGFKTLLYPHNQGAAMPTTTWSGSTLTVSWPGQTDVYTFSTRADGRTAFGMSRNNGQSFLMAGLTSYSPASGLSITADADGANVLVEANTVTVYGSGWEKITVQAPGITQVNVFDEDGRTIDMTGLVTYTGSGVIINEPQPPGSITVFSDDFESGTLSGWTTVSGTWTNALDGGTHAIKKTNTGEAIITAGSDWSDVTVSGKVKVLQTSSNGGLLFRYADADNYYHFRFYNNNIELYKKVNGTLTLVKSAPFPTTLNQWYTLKVEAVGDHILGYIDGELLVDWINPANELTSGKIGFRTVSNPSALFDDMEVAVPAP